MIFLDNTKNQSSKIRTRNWVEINDDSRETYNTGNGIRFKNSMLKSSLCDYSDAYISVKGTTTITGRDADSAVKHVNQSNNEVILKSFAPFTNCISKINNI